MYDDRTILRLVDRLYEAAADPRQWPSFLRELMQAMDAGMCALVHHDYRGHRDHISVSLGLGDDHGRRYEEYYAALNPWVRATPERRSGFVATSDMLVPRTELRRTEFFHDLLRPAGIEEMIGGIVLAGPKGMTTNITVHRPQRMGPFGEDDIALFERLMPHLQRAIQIHRRVRAVEAEQRVLLEALDRFETAVLVVDGDGKPRLTNAAADDLLRRRDGLSLERDGLRAETTAVSGQLRALIAQAALTSVSAGSHSGGAIALPRKTAGRPLSALVAPLRGRRWGADRGEELALLFVTDPEASQPAPIDLIVQVYELTRSEARLAASLMEGRTVAEAASTLGITAQTARTVLKHVLAKTGSHRQSELMRLLTRGPSGCVVRSSETLRDCIPHLGVAEPPLE